MTGEDVREFQRDLNARFDAWDIDKRIAEDGDYGVETRHGAKQVCIGLGILHETAMKHGVTPELRSKIRDPDTRTAQEKKRAEGAKAKEFRTKLPETPACRRKGKRSRHDPMRAERGSW